MKMKKKSISGGEDCKYEDAKAGLSSLEKREVQGGRNTLNEVPGIRDEVTEVGEAKLRALETMVKIYCFILF